MWYFYAIQYALDIPVFIMWNSIVWRNASTTNNKGILYHFLLTEPFSISWSKWPELIPFCLNLNSFRKWSEFWKMAKFEKNSKCFFVIGIFVPINNHLLTLEEIKKVRKKKYTYFIGIDVSKNELDFAVMHQNVFLFQILCFV